VERTLAEAGVCFPPAEIVADAAAVAAARRLGYPVAVKALGLVHKSDVGGIVLGLAGPQAVEAAVNDMAQRLSPPGFRVEAMVDTAEGVEVIVGVRRDPAFGPVVLVGLGGVLTELLADIAVGLAPFGRAVAQSMVDRLRGAPLLRGYRERPRLAEEALVDLLVTVSDLASSRPDLVGLDLNPVLVTTHGVVALDAHAEWAWD
jgi:acyl-CoA synthetase (NDP forming)